MNDLAKGLEYLRLKQKPLLEKIGHNNIEPDTLARYGLALQIEISEFVNETGWKIWKKKPADLSRVREEMADVLAFFGVWMLLLDRMGITVEELAEEYDRKNQINHDRFDGKVEDYGLPPGPAK